MKHNQNHLERTLLAAFLHKSVAKRNTYLYNTFSDNLKDEPTNMFKGTQEPPKEEASVSFTQGQHYTASELALRAQERSVEQTRDFYGAIKLARIYKDRTDQMSFAEIAIDWLSKALEYKPSNVVLSDVIDLDEFFHSFTYLSYPHIFEKSNQPLLDALKENTTIVEFSFLGLFNPRLVNERLAEYISETKKLRILDLNITCSHDSGARLQANHMHYVADGLRLNTSLEELYLTDQRIGDEGLIILLEALKTNPNTKLRILNLYDSGITEKGWEAIEAFSKVNKTLEYVQTEKRRWGTIESANATGDAEHKPTGLRK